MVHNLKSLVVFHTTFEVRGYEIRNIFGSNAMKFSTKLQTELSRFLLGSSIWLSLNFIWAINVITVFRNFYINFL